MMALLEVNAINIQDVVWMDQTQEKTEEDEDALIFVEQYYHIMAQLLKLIYEKEKLWKKVTAFYVDNKLNETFH